MIESVKISLTLINSGINIMRDCMNGQNYLLTAGEVAETLGVSKGYAYKLIRELNEELQSKGYFIVVGKVPKAFWETKFYGYNQPNQSARERKRI